MDSDGTIKVANMIVLSNNKEQVFTEISIDDNHSFLIVNLTHCKNVKKPFRIQRKYVKLVIHFDQV